MELLAVLLASFFGALLSSMSGGGTGIIIFPAFLALGMSYPMIVTTSAIMSAFWVLPASRNYLKGRKVDWPFIFFFSLIGLVGCYVGTLFVVGADQRMVETGAGIIILFLVTYTYFRKDVGVERHDYSRLRQYAAYPFALLAGFYETIFGSGNGIAVTMLTVYTKGFDLIDGLGHYYAISFAWTLFTAILLVQKGYFDLGIMSVAVIGSLAGAYIGSRYARNKGNKFIKILYVIIGGVLGLKLVLGV